MHVFILPFAVGSLTNLKPTQTNTPHDSYNNCVMIRETPDPELLACEDYEKHHVHGLQGLAELLTLSFIDIDSAARTFRFYCIQVRGAVSVFGSIYPSSVFVS
jgi:hypothetical protein